VSLPYPTPSVIGVADRPSAGCAKALLGKAVLPDDLPWVTGSMGRRFHRTSRYRTFSIALAKGDPDGAGVIKGTARQAETILSTKT
jgi:hypothetical protein